MREILFRGKQRTMLDWVEGTGVFNDGTNTWLSANESNKPIACGLNHKIVLPETVGQFTGLTDKNGKRAFEHDVIKHDFGDEIGVIRYGEYRCGHVGFYVDWVRGTVPELLRKDLAYWMKIVDILGNIHDNPELLEGDT